MDNYYYGDTIRWFIGVVVSNNDPLKLDRVKVRIHGVHTEDTLAIPDEDLPWAQVNIPVTEDGSSGLGGNSRLKNRAQVFGIFLEYNVLCKKLYYGIDPASIPNRPLNRPRFDTPFNP